MRMAGGVSIEEVQAACGYSRRWVVELMRRGLLLGPTQPNARRAARYPADNLRRCRYLRRRADAERLADLAERWNQPGQSWSGPVCLKCGHPIDEG
jgi:hypothetical protein